MKKFILLSHTRIRTYLNLLPSTLLMILAIVFNGSSEEFLKLWPLIIFMGGITLFLALFLFRVLYISVEDVKMLGPFSSRDKAVVKKGCTLVLTVRERGKVKVELLDDEGGAPVFDWMKDSKQGDVCLFRESVWGGTNAIKRVLRFFGVGDGCIEKLLTEADYAESLESVNVSCHRDESYREVKISFTETL